MSRENEISIYGMKVPVDSKLFSLWRALETALDRAPTAVELEQSLVIGSRETLRTRLLSLFDKIINAEECSAHIPEYSRFMNTEAYAIHRGKVNRYSTGGNQGKHVVKAYIEFLYFLAHGGDVGDDKITGLWLIRSTVKTVFSRFLSAYSTQVAWYQVRINPSNGVLSGCSSQAIFPSIERDGQELHKLNLSVIQKEDMGTGIVLQGKWEEEYPTERKHGEYRVGRATGQFMLRCLYGNAWLGGYIGLSLQDGRSEPEYETGDWIWVRLSNYSGMSDKEISDIQLSQYDLLNLERNLLDRIDRRKSFGFDDLVDGGRPS